MKICLVLFVVTVLFSCASKVKKEESNVAPPLLEEVKKEEGQKKEKDANLIEAPPEVIWGIPKDEAALKEWQRKVVEEADEFYYDRLASYYANNPHLQDEMIKYSEIMIKKTQRNGTFILFFYDYVEQSTSLKKDRLMARAIKYLNDLSKQNEGILTLMARSRLSQLYREGIYLPKDTVIAEYLYKGGGNLDSIIQTRKGE